MLKLIGFILPVPPRPVYTKALPSPLQLLHNREMQKGTKIGPKILIIRFSSLGDLAQAMGSLGPIRESFPEAEVHFATKEAFAPLVRTAGPLVQKVWALPAKNANLSSLISLGKALKAEKFDRIYDAHRNLRSFVLRFILLGPLYALFPDFLGNQRFVARSKERFKRFLLLDLPKLKIFPRINLFPRPYRGLLSYLYPLQMWGVKSTPPAPLELHFPSLNSAALIPVLDLLQSHKAVGLAPSAAWDKKRWPMGHFQNLIRLCPDTSFILLGGPEDTFCEDIARVAPQRVFNLAGKLSVMESVYVLTRLKTLVSADTGLLHLSDLMGKKAVGLMGPTAFGHTTGTQITELSVELACRPCTKDGRGGCVQSVYKKCMLDITPERVAQSLGV